VGGSQAPSRWLRAGAKPLLIGHKGAPLEAPENSLRSFEQALDLGADGVELDVIALSDGTLVLGHSLRVRELCHGAGSGRARGRSLAELQRLSPHLASFEQGLELLAQKLGDRTVIVDLKGERIAERVADALRAHGLAERALVSTLSLRSLRALRDHAPEIGRSFSYPQDRLGLANRRTAGPLVTAGLRLMRLQLGRRLASSLETASASAATIQHKLVTPALVEGCHALGVALFAWTVDDANRALELARAGVDGIITNDPRLLGSTGFPGPS
jgi:glycerophosphoryl diester phosphodiesterase